MFITAPSTSNKKGKLHIKKRRGKLSRIALFICDPTLNLQRACTKTAALNLNLLPTEELITILNAKGNGDGKRKVHKRPKGGGTNVRNYVLH